MPNEFIINNGYISKGNSSVTGNLSVSGTITSTSNINLSGFTNGSVLFASGSTGLITGSTNLFWDNTNGRLGIGTSSPSFGLDVTGTARVSSNINTSGQYTNINTNNFTTAPIALRTIGTDNTGISIYKASFAHNNAIQFLSNDTNNRFSIGQGYIGASNSLDFNIGRFVSSAWSDAFRIFNATGNISINSSTDAGYRLDVNGTTRIQDKLSVGTPTESSVVVEITSTNRGLLIPRMTSVQKLAITSPAVGLMVFDTNNNITEIYDSFWGWMPISNQNDWMRRWGMEYWNDFGANNAFNDGVYTTFATNGGGQGVTTTPLPLSSNSYIGYQGLRTGVNSNGTAQLRTDVNIGGYVFFGNGKFQFESRVFIRTLSTGTDRYNLIVGFSNSTSSTMAAGCTFIYDEGGVGTGTLVSPNWQIMTAFSSVRTVVDTGVAVSATTFYNFRVDINDNSTVVNYYLNNILVRTETTNIPPDGTRSAQPIIGITKTVGTTDIGILVDYIGLKKKFITPR